MVDSISVWISELSAPRRRAFWMLHLGVELGGVQGALHPPPTHGHSHVLPQDSAPGTADGALSPQHPSGLRLLDSRAASTLRGAELTQYRPAKRRWKREKWGQRRRFLWAARCWPGRPSLRGLRRERARYGKWWGFGEVSVWRGGWSVMFFAVGYLVFLALFLERTVLFSLHLLGSIFMN